jgi:GNAT superfamily N-acetyltransferase
MSDRSIRPGTLDDYVLFERFWAQLSADPPLGEEWWAGTYGDTLFLEEDGAPVGYACAYVLGAEGHLGHLVVDLRARRRGVGRELMNAVAARLRARGCSVWSLNVEEKNEGARALYRQCGMTDRHASVAISFPWRAVASLPRDERVVTTILDPSRDHEVESTLALPRRKLTRIRRIPGRVFVVAARDGRVVGVVAYEPVGASTPVLRAETPAVARALLARVHAEKEPTKADVRLQVDDDSALTLALTDAGGRSIMRTLRMEGPLL